MTPKRDSLTHLKVLPAAPAASPLTRALDMFVLDCEARRLAAKTLCFYRQQLGYFAQDAGVADLAGITPAVIRSYLVGLQKRGLSDGLIGRFMRSHAQ